MAKKPSTRKKAPVRSRRDAAPETAAAAPKPDRPAENSAPAPATARKKVAVHKKKAPEPRAKKRPIAAAEETGAFFGQSMAMDLSPEAVAALGTRSEGWVAGLQSAALSLRGQDDPEAVVAGFRGDDRRVAD